MHNINKTVADKQSARNSALKKSEYQPKYNKPHMIIPVEDSEWALQQVPSIQKFWLECWRSDPYGSRWMPLNTTLIGKTLKKAKAALRNKGLFDFKTEMRILEGKRYYETLVINLHGSRVKAYWLDGVTDDPTSESESSEVTDDPKMSNDSSCIGVVTTRDGVTHDPTNSPQTTQNQAFQKASVSSQQHLSNSSKELLRCDEDSPQRTAAAPCEGAPPVGVGNIEDFDEKVERRKKAQSRLKSMGSCGVCDFSFLQECWADMGLRIAVRVQLKKRPQWRLAVIDEQLVQINKNE